MAIYEVTTDQIRKIEETSFSQAGLHERTDLQRLLRKQVDIIAPETLIVAEEFGEWEDSKRRIDLLGIDKDANLVVIELKRTEDGGHMELQAIRYAAMVSTMTIDKIVEVFGSFLRRINSSADARTTLLDFLEWEEPDEDRFAQDVRIVLVSAEFSKELTTAVMWLNER
jgi:RecB family endonuclease NucS